MSITEYAGPSRDELAAYNDLANKSGRSLQAIVRLFEENRTRELFDDDGKLIRLNGIPGELALRLMQLEEMRR
ncbi:hypothetical protein DQP58_00095 [Mycobacterium colombiense]|uniref:Uncharacterized protein n=1 Tax=Mycobacterium colombiense TaxID=339268 RepID=A0A329KXY1_9MYCO|nr:hypothetical protein [Mycobacterium colombiense]RAV00675.1 hypothetical protein DQP58_00095 [Mycobacterium colombiense]